MPLCVCERERERVSKTTGSAGGDKGEIYCHCTVREAVPWRGRPAITKHIPVSLIPHSAWTNPTESSYLLWPLRRTTQAGAVDMVYNTNMPLELCPPAQGKCIFHWMTKRKGGAGGHSVGAGRTDTPHCSVGTGSCPGLLDAPVLSLALLVEDEPHPRGWASLQKALVLGLQPFYPAPRTR